MLLIQGAKASVKSADKRDDPISRWLVQLTARVGWCDLFSVNPATARGVPGLFSRNERVVCVFESARGLFLMALVGATIVGSIATVWHGVVNPPRPGTVRDWRYDDQNITLRQGDEMGRFLLGSTVVMLFPKDMLRLRSDWVPARTIQMGEAMARASCALRVARSAR